MAVSTKDQERLNGAQQSAVQNYTDQYYEAKARGDKAGMQAAHDAAERVRNQAGYSGGADGSAGSAPSRTAAEMERDVQQFNDVNYDSTQGRWTNGYTTEHNVRTKANAIRQQMLQNSQNWHTAGTQAERDYLHQQNLELNRILSQYAGGVESGYDPATGRWTTENADLGYGDIDPYDRANAKRLYGVTDAELDAYLRNTDRYFNYAQQHPLSYLGRNGAENQGNGGSSGYGLWLWQRLRLRRLRFWRIWLRRFQLRRVWIWRIWLRRTFRAARRLAQCGAGTGRAADRLCNGAGRRGAGTGAGRMRRHSIRRSGIRPQSMGGTRWTMRRSMPSCAATGAGSGWRSTTRCRMRRRKTGWPWMRRRSRWRRTRTGRSQDLRTQGEFAKANQVLEISQAYLQQLMSLEQWAAEYNLSAAKFQETVRQWENEFALSVGQVTGSYQGQTTLAAKKYSDSLLAESGSALLSAGVMPNGEQLAAMGLTQAQARLLLGQIKNGASPRKRRGLAL